jgi:FMN-dependent oxidoreductase (nitrilotriacetate monooxygenase family)
MGKPRKMRLVAFLKTGPTAHHHGMWRHPETDNDFLDPAWYEHVARVLEKGRFDCLFFADTLGLFDNYRGNFEAILRGGGQMGFLDPLPVLAVMSRVTQHIGLGATLSTTFHNPYQIARTLGTLDVLSKGRMAWNVVSSISNLEARNFGQDELPPRNVRYDRADEVMEACFKLWESWEPDALIVDKESGIFADPSKVHYVDYAGKWIKTRGPLTVPRSPQGHPVIMQAGASDRGRDFAARWSEMIFTLQHSKADMQTFYADIKQRVAKFGRPLEDCSVLPSVDPIIGETESIAREKQAYINEMVDPEVALALVSTHIGVDLSKYPIDQPLQDIEIEQGARGSFEVILQGTKAHGLTLGEAAKRFATSELAPQIVGTPKSVADQLQDYFESQACDGFILTPTVFPGTWEQFARSVVPELQKRGVFRTDYTGRTLREHLHD